MGVCSCLELVNLVAFNLLSLPFLGCYCTLSKSHSVSKTQQIDHFDMVTNHFKKCHCLHYLHLLCKQTIWLGTLWFPAHPVKCWGTGLSVLIVKNAATLSQRINKLVLRMTPMCRSQICPKSRQTRAPIHHPCRGTSQRILQTSQRCRWGRFAIRIVANSAVLMF